MQVHTKARPARRQPATRQNLFLALGGDGGGGRGGGWEGLQTDPRPVRVHGQPQEQPAGVGAGGLVGRESSGRSGRSR